MTVLDTAWMAEAGCRGQVDLFFSEERGDVHAARAICAVCPVTDRCADYASLVRAVEGVWAGADMRPGRLRPRRTRSLCRWCGQMFTLNHHRNVYCCSDGCRYRSKVARQAAYTARKKSA